MPLRKDWTMRLKQREKIYRRREKPVKRHDHGGLIAKGRKRRVKKRCSKCGYVYEVEVKTGR